MLTALKNLFTRTKVPSVPKPTRLLDYRRTGWGHAIGSVTEKEDGTHCYIFSQTVMQAGDLIVTINQKNKNQTFWVVKTVEAVRNPHDMYWVTMKHLGLSIAADDGLGTFYELHTGLKGALGDKYWEDAS